MEFAATHNKAEPIHLTLSEEHTRLIMPSNDGAIVPDLPSVNGRRVFHEVAWDPLAAQTKAHTLIANAGEVVHLNSMHHGPTQRNVLRARDQRLPTGQAMRWWQQKVTRQVYPPLPHIFCRGGGAEEDTTHMRMVCERSLEVAKARCARVEDVIGDLPLANKAM